MNGNCGSQNNVYIGARYVPRILGEWSADMTYEPLDVVLYQGTSYTSRTYVPKGIIPSESTQQYWALTGNYNAQVEMYRQDVEKLRQEVSDLDNNVADINNKLTKTYENVNSMLSDTSLTNGNFARTLGYYSKNDGGGATYYISDAKIGEFYCIENNGLFYHINEYMCNVNMYGAKGNGTSNDTTFIQNAINDCILKNIELNFLTKTYLCETLNIEGNIVLNGNNATLQRITAPFEELQYYILRVRNECVINDFTLIGDKNSQTNGTQHSHGLDIRGCNNVTVNNIKVSNTMGDGIYINQVQNCFINGNIIIDNCIRNGISLINGEDIYIDNVYISNLNSQHLNVGVDLEPNISSEYLKNVTINSITTNNCKSSLFIINKYNVLDNIKINYIYSNDRDYCTRLSMALPDETGEKNTNENNSIYIKNIVGNFKNQGLLFLNWFKDYSPTVYIDNVNALTYNGGSSNCVVELQATDNQFGTTVGNIYINDIKSYNTEKLYRLIDNANSSIANVYINSNNVLANQLTNNYKDYTNVITLSGSNNYLRESNQNYICNGINIINTQNISLNMFITNATIFNYNSTNVKIFNSTIGTVYVNGELKEGSPITLTDSAKKTVYIIRNDKNFYVTYEATA